MTNKTSETLKALFAKAGLKPTAGQLYFAEQVLEADTVELANIGSTNPDWNPMDHPRNQLGHFVKKGAGVFLLGQNKKGTFKTPGAAKDIDYDLEPGDIAYNSPLGNVYVKHPDGSWTATMTTGGKQQIPASDNKAFVLNKKIEKGSYKKFDEAPATEVHADSIEQAEAAKTNPVKVGDTLTAAQIDLLPEGSQVEVNYWSYTVDKDGNLLNEAKQKVDPTKLKSPTLKKVGAKAAGSPEKPAEAIEEDNPKPSTPEPGKDALKAADAALDKADAATSASEKLMGAYKKVQAKKTSKDLLDEKILGIIDSHDSDGNPKTPEAKNGDLAGKKVKSIEEMASAPDGTTIKVQPQGDQPEMYEKKGGDWYYKYEEGSLADNSNPTSDFEYLLKDSNYEVSFDQVAAPEPVSKGGLKKGDVIQSTKDLDSLPVGSDIEVNNDYMGSTDGSYRKTEFGWVPFAAIHQNAKLESNAFPSSDFQEELDDSDISINVKSLGTPDTSDGPVGEVKETSQPKPGSAGSDPWGNYTSPVDDVQDSDANDLEDWEQQLLGGDPGSDPWADDDEGTPTNFGPGDTVTGSTLFNMPLGTVATWNKGIPVDVEKKTMGSGEVGWENKKIGGFVYDEAIKSASATFTIKKVGGPSPEEKAKAFNDALAAKATPSKEELKPQVDSVLSILDAMDKQKEAPKAAPVPVAGKKNKLTAASEFDAAEEGATFQEVNGQNPGDSISNDKGFTHPVSGESFPLEPGDKLLQHKLTPASFAVMDKDGNKKFQINKNGKKYKWSPHIPKSNFGVVFTADKGYGTVEDDSLPDINDYLKGNTFTHPASGLAVEIGPDEVLMQHNFTPHSYLVMGKDGSMKYKIDVKGKKQKAGTNLKPSNYFVAKEGKEPKNLLDGDFDPGMASLGEVQTYLDDADPGDFFDADMYGSKQTLTKQPDGSWQNQDGVTWADYQVASGMFTDAPKGSKSDYGLPLNPDEFEAWAEDLAPGSQVMSQIVPPGATDEIIFTKQDNGLWSGGLVGAIPSSILAKSLGQNGTVANKKAMSFYAAPKKKTNDHDVPVHGTSAEMKSFLDSQPVGSVLTNGGDGSFTKTSTGWSSSTNGSYSESSVFMAESIINYWNPQQKNDLKVSAPKKTTNEHGFPAYDSEEAIAKSLDSQEVGVSLTLPTGVFKKNDDGTWSSTGNSIKLKSSTMAGAIGTIYTDAQKSQVKYNAVAEVKAKVAAQKKSASTATVKPGAPTKVFGTEDAFTKYADAPQKYQSGSGDTLFEDIGKVIHGKPEYVHGYNYNQYDPFTEYNVGGSKEGVPYFDKMADVQVVDAIQEAINNLEAAKKDKGLLTASLKAKTTKTIAKLKEFQKLVNASVKLKAGELPTPEEMPDLDYSYGIMKTWPWDMSYAHAQFKNKYSQVKFSTESKSIGWDPFDGTDEQYTEWLKKEGHSGTEFLSLEDKKKLALHYMGAPGKKLSLSGLNSFTKKITQAKFTAVASEALAKKNGAPFHPKDSKPGVAFPKPPEGYDDLGSYSFPISPAQWNLVQFALSDDYPEDLSQVPVPSWAQKEGPLSFVPPNALKALATVGDQQSWNASQINTLAGYLLKSGIWFDDHLVYEHPVHGKFPLSPGMEVWVKPTHKKDTVIFVPKGTDFEDGYTVVPSIDYDGDWTTQSFYTTPDSAGFTKAYTAPYKISLSDAKKDGQNFKAKDWEDLENAEGFVSPKTEFSGNESVKLKELLKNHPVAASDLTDKAKTLMLENPAWADMIAYKDLKGHYRVVQTPEAKWEDFTKGHSHLPHLADIKDPTNEQEVLAAIKKWGDLNVGEALLALGESPTGEESHNELLVAAKHAIMGFGKQEESFNAPAAEVGVSGSLKPITGFSLGGGQPKKYFADANGDKYMAKVNTTKKFRPDSEHAATSIFSMFGFNVPPTTVREINGDYMIVSKVLDVAGDLDGKSLESMSDKQLASAMSSHPMDWSVSNHDTHGGNFLVLSDGETLVNIDKGQAWKALGSDKLEVGWELPGNFGGVWYNKFYTGVKNKSISKERLDFVAQAVLKKARQISLKNDDEYRAHLEEAFKNRTSFPKGMSKAAFIDLAMKRKQDTFTDFLKFYEGIYKSGGHKFEWKAEDFESTQLDGSDAHLDISPDFIDSVKKNGLYGKSLFFAGKEVEDAHAHIYVSSGGKNVHADMKIQNEGDAKIKQWLKAQGVSTQVVANTPEAQATNGLPDSTQAWPKLVNLAKTVSTHAGDKAYNQDTVSIAKTAQATLKDQLSKVQENIAKDPLYVSKGTGGLPKFETGHQQQAWLAWGNDILPKFDATLEAMEKGEKSPKHSQTEPVYTAPKGIDVSGKPKAVETLESPDGKKFTKYSDWNYIGPDGPIQQDEYEALQSGQGWKTTSLKTDDAPKQESTQVSKKKTFKITKGKAKTMVTGTPKKDETGTVVDLELDSSEQTSHGSAYWITSPDYPGIEIQYEDRSEASDRANRGRLQWRIKDWDGSQDRVEEAFAMIREMGLSLDAADDKSMELFYWRHMMGALNGRKGAHKGKEKQTLDKWNQGYSESMGDEAELALLKEAFAISMGQDRVDKADWKPKFGQERATQEGFDGEVTGRPSWHRPDMTIAQLKQWSKSRLPSRTFWHSGTDGSDFASMSRVLFSGIQLSNEEKSKFNGKFGTGGSAGSDRGNGSSRVVYLRQNQELGGQSGVLFEPHVLQRTTNYMANHDSFGSLDERDSSSPWNAKDQTTKATSGSNEVMIKYSMSAWDDIAVAKVDAAARKKLLDYYAKKGITEIRGIPIEERIVTSEAQMNATMKKVWEMALAAEEKAGLA